MNRRNSILLALAVLALAVTAVVVGVVVSRDDDEGASETTTTEAATSTPAPTFDAPGAAAPGEQDQTDDDVLGDWTAQDIEDAIANPRTPPPDTAPAADPPGASTEPSAAGGQTAPSVEPTEPGPRSGTAAAKRCAQPPKVAPLRDYQYSRDCYKRSFAAFPAKAMGILFFKVPGGGGSQCTASVAVTRIGQTKGNESVIVTAGHCLGLTPRESASGNWEPFTNAFWLSTPSFEEFKRTKFANQAAFDRWLAANVWLPFTWAGSKVPVGYVPSPWKNGSGWRYDFGTIVVQPRGTTTILKKVGGLGVNMTGAGAGKRILSYGYPADKPFDGSTLFICDGKSKVGDKVTTAGTRTALGIGCDMTGGSSGGPWLRAGDRGLFVVSVNSYGPAGPPRSVENVMFGPNLNGDHWATFVAARDHR